MEFLELSVVVPGSRIVTMAAVVANCVVVAKPSPAMQSYASRCIRLEAQSNARWDCIANFSVREKFRDLDIIATNRLQSAMQQPIVGLEASSFRLVPCLILYC